MGDTPPRVRACWRELGAEEGSWRLWTQQERRQQLLQETQMAGRDCSPAIAQENHMEEQDPPPAFGPGTHRGEQDYSPSPDEQYACDS